MHTKIQFSEQEKDLIARTDWILTKQSITQKIYELFGAVNEAQKEMVKHSPLLSSGSFSRAGRIYKGEQYLGLPYIILDHPALFTKENIFVIRTMFWWGNFFSVTLHISGNYKAAFGIENTKTLAFLQHHNFSICVNKDQWEHHFNGNNYLPSGSFSLQQFEKVLEKNFLKVSKRIPLESPVDVYDFLVRSFGELIELVTLSYPDGEKGPLPGFPIIGSGL